MKKGIRGKIAVLSCLLLALTRVGWAAESPQGAVEETVLDEVVVSAVHLDKYLVTTTVITDKDIEAKGARNLSEVLEDVPGLNLHAGKKGNTSLEIRGATSSDVKIYVDGILMNPLVKMTNTSTIDISMIPVDNIAKIEIIKGPAPVIYGTDAKGGVIVITTKNGNDYKGGQVNLAYGNWSSVNGGASIGGGDKKYNYYFDVGTMHTNGYMNYKNDEQYINAKLKWTFANNSQLTFTGNYSTTDKDCQNAIDPNTGNIISYKSGFWPALNYWQYRDWNKLNLALDYVQRANKKLDYDVKFYYQSEDQGLWANGANWDSSVPYKKSFGYSTSRWNASFWNSRLTGVELASNWQPNEQNKVTFGALYNSITWAKSDSTYSDPDNFNWLNYNSTRFGYYVQDNILANDRTTITLGLRNDSYRVGYDTDISGSATNPSVNMTYQLDKRNTLRASYGQTYSFPTAEQLFGSSGNPDLKPERATNYELGIKHQFDSTFEGDLAIFKNSIYDKINRKSKAYLYQNLESAQIQGIELELKKTFNKKLKGFVNYTLLDTSSTDLNGVTTPLSYTPKNHVNYGFIYEAGKGYRINLTGHWIDQRFTNDSTGSDTRSSNTVYSYLPSYNVIDLKISRQINKNMDWYVTVHNLFDVQYEEELFYPSPGIWFMVGTNYKF